MTVCVPVPVADTVVTGVVAVAVGDADRSRSRKLAESVRMVSRTASATLLDAVAVMLNHRELAAAALPWVRRRWCLLPGRVGGADRPLDGWPCRKDVTKDAASPCLPRH